MKKMKFIGAIIILSILSACVVKGQDASGFLEKEGLSIEKRECLYKGEQGYKLIIHFKVGNMEKISTQNNYSLTGFLDLSDSIKLQMVGKLLRYKDDTSTVCIPVSNYGYEGYENTCNIIPKSKKYTIQLDALYLINKLCFPHAASFYYCYPTLMDTSTNNEVNPGNLCALQNIYKIYEEWYDSVKQSGLIKKDFPFNSGQYIWYGGRKSGKLED